MKIEREYNFELLKSLCILLIVVHHFFTHGLFDGIVIENNLLKMLLVSFLGSFGKCASLIFILISGYFMINKKMNYKKILRIVFQFFIYSLTILIVFLLIRGKINIKLIIKLLFPIIFGNWFVITYIQLLIISPLLNRLFKNCERAVMKKSLVLCIICFFIIPTFIPNTNWSLSCLGIFAITYLCGMYINYYHINISKTNILTLVFSLVIVSLFDYINITHGNLLINFGIDFDSLNSIFMFMIAISIFLIFKSIKIKNINLGKIFGVIAKSSLGIYILHDNFIVRSVIWNEIFPNSVILSSDLFFIFYPLKILLIYVIFLLIDKVLMFLYGKLINMLSNKTYNIVNFLFKKVNILE